MVASNWAVGTFLVVTVGTWYVPNKHIIVENVLTRAQGALPSEHAEGT